jgi:two-component sensor histidine kinase
MHPILASPVRLALYLLAWFVPGGVLAGVLAASGAQSLREALAVTGPLMAVYALVCLSPWYMCRVTPLRPGSMVRVLFAHSLAAAAASLLLVAAATQILPFAEKFLAAERLEQRFTQQFPLLFGMGVLFYLLAVAIHYVFLSVEASRAAEKRALESQVLAREGELKVLRMQVNPHFLFNSLNSISALTTVDPAKARRMCIILSEFLRSSLGLGDRESIEFAEELALVRSYLAIEQVRFGARLRVEEDVAEDCRSCAVPPLLLQPLVENAVKHGAATALDGGWIRLTARRREGQLTVAVENGFDPDAPPAAKNGLGLVNVRRRLEVRYGPSARLDAGGSNGRYRAEMILPAERAVAS